MYTVTHSGTYERLMYVCVYVCVCMCVCVCIYIYIYIYIYIDSGALGICMGACTCIYMHVCMRHDAGLLQAYTNICIHAYCQRSLPFYHGFRIEPYSAIWSRGKMVRYADIHAYMPYMHICMHTKSPNIPKFQPIPKQG